MGVLRDLDGLTEEQAVIVREGLLWGGPPLVWQSPTGSGKTFMARLAMRRALDQGLRGALLVPLRAIANEVTARLGEDALFEDVRAARLTGELAEDDGSTPLKLSDARLIVATYEKLDSLLRRPGTHFAMLAELGVVVVDEAHVLGDGRRGAILEGALVRLRAINPMVQIILLSATLGNGKEIAQWLGGVFHQSHNRPVPLTWQTRKFRKAAEKAEIAASACQEVAADGGQSIVFVQSRKRAEDLAQILSQTHGLRAAHHHAGLTRAQRERVEGAFRTRSLDVICATPTLAAGVNLRVRQVVIYDSQRYAGGGTYEDLSVIEVWQRAGRAGRLGLDDQGVAVVLQPSWIRRAPDYSKGAFEAVRSSLMDRRWAAEQVLVAVSAGYARTSDQIVRLLMTSLAATQRRLPAIPGMVETMVSAGMLSRDEDGCLYATRAGHIAVAHMLAPEGVLALVRFLAEVESPTVFDVLTVCAALPGSDFSVWSDRSSCEALDEALGAHASVLIGRDVLLKELGLAHKTLGDALARAAVLMRWAACGDAQQAGALAGYSENDALALRQEVLRVLQAAGALVDRVSQKSQSRQIQLAYAMVAAGLEGEAAELALLPGVGPVLARRLLGVGITGIKALAHAQPDTLARIPGVSTERAAQWRFAAEALLDTDGWGLAADAPETGTSFWDASARANDAQQDYRAMRARELKVAAPMPGTYTVTGGSEPHQVVDDDGTLRCDCADFANGHHCKHVIAVGLIHPGTPYSESEGALTSRFSL